MERVGKEARQIHEVVLLSDDAAQEDLLAFHDGIGAHDRTAAAIARIIRTQEGGKVIGIEGGWGSGKTTVVNLLEQKLEDEKEIAVFRFDAWAHEGDPLRRAFLDSLICHLLEEAEDERKWIEDERREYWEKVRDRLGKRSVDQETTITPRVKNRHAILALLLLVGLPVVGSGLMAGAAAQGITFGTGYPVSWLFLLGMLAALAGPLFFA